MFTSDYLYSTANFCRKIHQLKEPRVLLEAFLFLEQTKTQNHLILLDTFFMKALILRLTNVMQL